MVQAQRQALSHKCDAGGKLNILRFQERARELQETGLWIAFEQVDSTIVLPSNDEMRTIYR